MSQFEECSEDSGQLLAAGVDSAMNRKEVGFEREITAKWRDYLGDYAYELTTFTKHQNGERYIYDTVYGDKEWAGRVANYYGLEVPKTPEV